MPKLLRFMLCLAVLPVSLHAEIYAYLDSRGIYTITNVPPPSDATIVRTLEDGPDAAAPSGPLGLKPATPPETYEEQIVSSSRAHGIDPGLVKAVIWVESCYNPKAVSNKGARGLMQLLPDTGRRFGVADLFDPSDNIEGGVKYLRFLLDLFHDDAKLSLAAYNAGEKAVQRYNGIPPYRETKDYVAMITRIYGGNLQTAIRAPIYRVDDGSGNITYTNIPPPPGPSTAPKAETIVK